MSSSQSPQSPNGVYLTRDQILNANDAQYEIVDVPEWGGKVRVKALTGAERDSYEQSLMVGVGKNTKVDMGNARAKLASRALVDAQGERVFVDVRDVEKLGKKSAAALDRVYEVACRLAKITKDDIEDLKGNSESGPSDVSSSG